MKSSSAKSHAITDSSRCAFSTGHGHRCRMLASPGARCCASHSRHDKLDAAALAAELSQAAGSLESPEDVNRLLSKTVLAFIEGRLPLKKASMIGFLGQIILRTHREIVFHEKVERDNHPENDYLFPDLHDDESTSTSDSPAPVLEQKPLDPPAAQAVTPSPTTSTDVPVAPEQTNAPPPAPAAPAKIPDLSHFYPNDPTLDPRFNAYHPIPYIPAERDDEPVWPGERPPGMRSRLRRRPLPHRPHTP